MLIDFHCHLNHSFYKKDLKKILERAKKANIGIIITNGINYETNLISLKLAEKYPIVKPALGFYPVDALDKNEINKSKKGLDENLKLIEKNKDKILAIGEVGLDLYHGRNLEKQTKDFQQILTLAIKLNKPIIIHTRKAEKQTLEILEKSKIKSDKIILHCFSANKKLINLAIKKKYNFSLPTNLVRSETFQYIIKNTPLNQILTETDGPYLSPFQNENKSFNRNEPAYIKESIKKIAEIKNLSQKEVENTIEENYKRIFLS
jgi:TatD DNase family protein